VLFLLYKENVLFKPSTQVMSLVVHLHFSSWKGLLLACDGEMKTASGKWWFHLRSLCHSQAMEGNSHFPIEFLLLEISTNIQK